MSATDVRVERMKRGGKDRKRREREIERERVKKTHHRHDFVAWQGVAVGIVSCGEVPARANVGVRNLSREIGRATIVVVSRHNVPNRL